MQPMDSTTAGLSIPRLYDTYVQGMRCLWWDARVVGATLIYANLCTCREWDAFGVMYVWLVEPSSSKRHRQCPSDNLDDCLPWRKYGVVPNVGRVFANSTHNSMSIT